MKLDLQLFATGGIAFEGDIKYVGMYTMTSPYGGPTQPAYIIITETLGALYATNASTMRVYLNLSPGLDHYEQYTNTRTYNFTYMGEEQRFYEDIVFNDIKYIFTPIGIITPINIENLYAASAHAWSYSFDILNLNGPDYTDYKGIIHKAGYIPTTSITRTPAGLNGTTFEDVNLLVPYRKNSFLGTAGTTTYQLAETGLDSSYVVTAQILQSNGTHTTIKEGSGLTVNDLTGVVTFSTAPGVSPIAGQDNVIITYSKTITKTKTIENVNYYTTSSTTTVDRYMTTSKPIGTRLVTIQVGNTIYIENSTTKFTVNRSTNVITIKPELNNEIYNTFDQMAPVVFGSDYILPDDSLLICGINTTAVTSFGYEQDRRVFVTDGTNKDVFSAPNDIRYFPSSNYTIIGDETGIAGYARGNGYLFTTKIGTDAIYVRQGMLINNVVVFPSIADTPNIKILGKPMELEDGEVLIPTNRGIERLSYYSGEIKNELRSYYITNTLSQYSSSEWKYSSWIVAGNMLYIQIGNKILIADLLQKTYVKDGASPTGSRYSTSLAYQYEWYVWDNISISYSRLLRHDNAYPDDLYLYNYLYMCKLDKTKHYDYIYEIIPSGSKSLVYKPIEAYWETPFLDFNQINVAKTIKNLYLNTRSTTGDYFEIGYILPDGTTEILEQQYGTLTDTFPKLIQIKNKIKKFMNVKLYIKSKKMNMDNNKLVLYSNTSTKTGVTFVTNKSTGTITINGTSTDSFGDICKISHMTYLIYPNYLQPNYLVKLNTVLPTGITCEILSTRNGVVLHELGNIIAGESEKLITVNDYPSYQIQLIFRPTYNTPINNLIITPKVYNTADNMTDYLYGTAYPYINQSTIETYKNTTFNRLLIEYQAAGKYRGE